MSLSTKLTAQYTELANSYLDCIPVRTEADLEVVSKALQTLIDANTGFIVPDNLQGRITSLNDLLSGPEMYAAPEHIEPFKSIVLGRVAAKIKELRETKPQDLEHLSAQVYKQFVPSEPEPVAAAEVNTVVVDTELLNQMSPDWSGRDSLIFEVQRAMLRWERSLVSDFS